MNAGNRQAILIFSSRGGFDEMKTDSIELLKKRRI
jgi:hypothetical protein